MKMPVVMVGVLTTMCQRNRVTCVLTLQNEKTMKKYRIEKEVCRNVIFPQILIVAYHVQVKFLWFWVTIKTFVEDDPNFALQLAEELLDKLNEE